MTLQAIARSLDLPVAQVKQLAARMGVNVRTADELQPALAEALMDFIRQDMRSAPVPPPASPTRPIKDVLEHHRVELLARTGVQGVGIAEDRNGTPYIQLYTVAPAKETDLPQQLEGYALVPRVVGRIVARGASEPT